MSDGIRRCFQLIVYCMSRSYIHVLQARLSNRTARNCPCRPHDINFTKSSTQPEETSISASSRISNLTHRSYLESLTIQKVDCASVMNIMNVYFPNKTHHNMEFPLSMLIWTNQLRLIPALSWPLGAVSTSFVISTTSTSFISPFCSRSMASIPRLLPQLGVFSISWGSFGGIAFFAICGLNSNNLRLSNKFFRMQEIKNIKQQN